MLPHQYGITELIGEILFSEFTGYLSVALLLAYLIIDLLSVYRPPKKEEDE
jgi:hypothetical protein